MSTGRDLAVLDGNVGFDAFAARSIKNGAVADDKIVSGRHLLLILWINCVPGEVNTVLP